MNIDRKAALIYQVLDYLKKENVGSVPDAILGFNKYPENTSKENDELRIIENELISIGLAIPTSNRLNGYQDLNLKSKAYEFNSIDDIMQLYNSVKFINAVQSSVPFSKTWIEELDRKISEKEQPSLMDSKAILIPRTANNENKKQMINNFVLTVIGGLIVAGIAKLFGWV